MITSIKCRSALKPKIQKYCIRQINMHCILFSVEEKDEYEFDEEDLQTSKNKKKQEPVGTG